jgi:PDZ domain-containing protein
MTSASTADESVAAPPRGPGEQRAHHRGFWTFVATFAVLGSIIGASWVRVPYYSISPGNALAVAPLVQVKDGPSYPPKGAVYLCTVALQRTTILQAVRGWLDPTVDVVKEQAIKPKEVTNKDLRTYNLQLMDTSKEQALGVAFEQLGFDAITGKGAQVVTIVKGSPADGPLSPGDTITAVDGTATELHTEAVRLLGSRHPGDTVRLTVAPEKGGTPRDVSVELAENPKEAGRPLLGVTLRTRSPSFDFPYQVDIGSEQIGGPSAGLAFTLEVLDVLTKGELTGGQKVAATGTIELDGSVGEVGGVAQKAVAVEEAGVRLFLVPRAEVAQARKHASSKLRIEPVDDLQDALRILSTLGGNGLALDRVGDHGA